MSPGIDGAVRSNDEGRWGGAANRWQQGSHTCAKVEDPCGRVKRQLVDQLDACRVYCRCPPLLVGLSGCRVVGGEQLDWASRLQGHSCDQREFDALITTDTATACCFCGGMSWRISEIT
jgi:hypothetical protein